jgi:hypothetical protein
MRRAAFERIKPMIAYITFTDNDGAGTNVPFLFDVLDISVNGELMDVSRFKMKHFIPNLWENKSDSITVDSIDECEALMDTLADEK